MKRKKREKSAESNIQFLHALDWVTKVLKRYNEGQLSEQEEQSVQKQLQSIDHLTDDTKVTLTQNQLYQSDKKIKKQVFSKLNLIDPENESEKASPVLMPKRTIPFTASFRKYAAVAAVFAVVFGLSYFTLFNEPFFLKNNFAQSVQHKTIFLQTGASEVKELVLPDGTKLYANADTRIEYDKSQFNKSQREIWISGEAFFEVAKNPKKPFIIHSGNIQTTVRGTSFNVKAYQEIGEISVSVRTGKVEVGTEGESFGILTPNKQLSYNERTKKHTIAESSWEDAAAWKDHRLVLKNANIAELKLRIRQLYNVEITVDGTILDNESFGLSFQKSTDLADVMTVVEQLYDVKYEETNSNNIRIYRD